MIRIALAAFVAGFAMWSVPAAVRSARPVAGGLALVGSVAGLLVAHDAIGDYSDLHQGVAIMAGLSTLSANALALICGAGGVLVAHRTVDA